jgi:SAM-dependent methyltransferase
MTGNPKPWKATTDWESSYFHTRRNRRRRRRRLKHFRIPLAAKILELGCGDGLNLELLHAMGYRSLIGVDNSALLLSRIEGESQVIQGDALGLPFKGASFDVVLVDSVFHHLEFEPTLKEIIRILNDGGRLCFIEPRNSFMRRLLDLATLSPIARWIPLLYHRQITLLDEYEVHYDWLRREASIPGQLKKAGFTHVQISKDALNLLVSCHKSSNLRGAAI